MAKEFNIARMGPRCQTCDLELPPGSDVVATLTETKDDFVRSDYCPACWGQRPDEAAEAEFFCTWRTRVPEAKARKKLFVDNDLLINFFERLAGAAEPAKVNFRFVLALVLMRKRLLVYGRSEKRPDGSELWHMTMKHNQSPHEVVDPKMDEAMIEQVSGQLGQILEGEL